MPKISFTKPRPSATQTGGSTLEVEAGTNLMEALLAAGLPVASSCRGDGVCAKCRIEIVEGAKNLSPETELETFLRERHSIPKNQRVSCQTQIQGDITVTTSYW
ncbi:MAG: (2Fe-2S)-binding protein [Proteobacteria bacterium]|nr:MAG: (2Fe-2S)-binding protein [Pseudomonadota bacterium]